MEAMLLLPFDLVSLHFVDVVHFISSKDFLNFFDAVVSFEYVPAVVTPNDPDRFEAMMPLMPLTFDKFGSE